MTDPPRRGLWIIALTISILWVVVIYFLGPKPRPIGGFGGQSLRYRATFDWTLYDLEGRPVSFERFKGKPIFLNIWATWCPPCVAEMPSIASLAKTPKLKEKGVEFVCVATDESADAVRNYLQGKGWPMTFLRADSLPLGYQTEGIPATFAISPEGIVVGAVEGSSDWDQPDVVKFLEELSRPPETPPGPKLAPAPKSPPSK